MLQPSLVAGRSFSFISKGKGGKNMWERQLRYRVLLATTLGLVAFRALAAEPASPAVEVKFFLNPTTVLDAHHQPNRALRTAFQVAAEPVTIRMQLAATHAEDFKTRVTQHDRENTFPFENVAAMKASGYTNMTVPAERGGGGANLVDLVL